MNTALTIDTETTTFEHGNAYSQKNKLCYVGMFDGELTTNLAIEYGDAPYGEALTKIQRAIDNAYVLVFFNAKFDIAWLRRYGIDCSNKRIHDCQLVHFILTNQKTPYPSLNGVAEYYKLGTKIDVVKEEYWNKGIDTPDIPKDVLEEYLGQDLSLTHQVYLKQIEDIERLPLNRQRLISLHNQDLLVLQEIEHNGIKYDSDKSKELAEVLSVEITKMDEELSSIHNISGFNPNSGDMLSSLLYGGVIRIPVQVDTGEVYKTGIKAGQVKLRWSEELHNLDRLVTPLKGTELAKEGYWSTGEPILKRLKARGLAKKIIDIILKRATMEKLRGTYYEGLPKLIEKYDWEDNTIHGQFNQCVAKTGRLSSSKPNNQNFSSEIKELFYSRFGYE